MRTGITYVLLLAMLPVFFFSACKKDQTQQQPQNPLLQIPPGFPPVNWPADNAFTQDRWELGKKLFFDPILSIDGSISCASCHAPALAFADTIAFSPGVFNRPGTRNAPSLANVAYHPYLLREGSVPTLEMQVLVPIQEANEFNHNIVDIAEILKNMPEYVSMSLKAYNREPDAFVITRALATFQRTLISGNAPYDRYLNGEKTALSPAEIRGAQLFFSAKTDCSACHGGFNFTFYGFENNGLYDDYADNGRERLTGNPADRALFKTPSLRNVAVTPPYMHDGSMLTLEDVIEHYISGGKAHPSKSPLIRPLSLSPQEKADLVAFLNSLTDETFLSNQAFNK